MVEKGESSRLGTEENGAGTIRREPFSQEGGYLVNGLRCLGDLRVRFQSYGLAVGQTGLVGTIGSPEQVDGGLGIFTPSRCQGRVIE